MSVLSNIFKPETKKNWQQLASEIGAEFVYGGFWNDDKIILNYRKTKIILDTYTTGTAKNKTTYTRIKSEYISTNGFTFSISSESFFTHLIKRIGFNDIEIGDFKFDDKMYIKTYNEEKVKTFFVSPILKKEVFDIVKGSNSSLSINRAETFFFYTEGETSNPFYIILIKRRVESDIEILKSWFDLCKITLDRLIEIGEAEDANPDI
jgi:hypothetical protein